ncbi:MAG: histidine kinase dimerization/phosphoacceptor domain -containing protein [Methanobacteriaceae archaeon]
MANEKILVVEDEELVAQDIKVILEDLGYQVPAMVASGEEAVKKVKKINPDSVLIDIMLEGKMDGIEAAEKIKQLYDIPIVYITAYGNEEVVQRAKKTEPHGYILKPFQEKELQISLEMALYKHEAEKTRKQLLEQKIINENLNKALEEKEVLLKEIDHRVKNNMQIIISLLSLQSRYFEEGEVVEFFRDSINRVKSMAMIHEKVFQSDNLSSIDFGKYIPTLVSGISSSYESDSKIKIDINIKDIHLNIDTAMPCGLIINELVTNSLKHAFNGEEGEILVEMESNADDCFTLVVSDNGRGLPDDIDMNKALGLRLVDTLIKQLDANMEIHRNGGTRFVIKFQELKYNERF